MTRSRTTERKRSRERQQRRRRLVMVAVSAATIVVLLAIFLITANQPTEAPIPEGALERFPTELESRTTEGYPRLGLASAPLQVSWYCAFDSIDCATFHDAAIDQLAAWARDGEILLTYVPLYGQTGNTQGASRAVVCAAQQQAAWPLLSAFYHWRQEYGEIQAFTNNRIISGLDQIPGLNRAEYDACIRGNAPGTALVEALNDQRGVTGMEAIPAVTLNNVILVGGEESGQLTTADAVLAALEEAIAGTTRPTPEPTSAPVAEVEATPDAEVTEAPAETTPEEAPVVEVTEAPTVEATAEATPE